jgi:hypothetical protein
MEDTTKTTIILATIVIITLISDRIKNKITSNDFNIYKPRNLYINHITTNAKTPLFY